MSTPNFKQFKASLSAEELTSKMDEESKSNRKFFDPGLYEVQLVSAEWQERKEDSKSDPTWVTVVLTFGAKEGKQEIKEFLSLPTKSEYYKDSRGKSSLLQYTKLVHALQAFGMINSPSEVSAALGKYFSDLDKLKGMHTKITVGYRGLHRTYEEDSSYRIRDAKGKAITDAAGNERVFSSVDEIELWLAENDKRLEFPRILKFEKSSTENTFVTEDEIPF